MTTLSPYLTVVREVREALHLPPMGSFSPLHETTDELITKVLGLPRATHRQFNGCVYTSIAGVHRVAVSGSSVVNTLVLACEALEAGAAPPVPAAMRQDLLALVARIVLDPWLNRGLGFEEALPELREGTLDGAVSVRAWGRR